jgi:hypothetical protein
VNPDCCGTWDAVSALIAHGAGLRGDFQYSEVTPMLPELVSKTRVLEIVGDMIRVEATGCPVNDRSGASSCYHP